MGLLCSKVRICDESHDRVDLRCVYYNCGAPYSYCYTCGIPDKHKCEKCKFISLAKFQADRKRREEKAELLHTPPITYRPMDKKCNKCYETWIGPQSTCPTCEEKNGIIRCAYFPCNKVLTIDYEKSAGYHVVCDPHNKCICGRPAIRGSVACYECVDKYNCRHCGKQFKIGNNAVCSSEKKYLRQKECVCGHSHGNERCTARVLKNVNLVRVVTYTVSIPGIYHNSTGRDEHPFQSTEEVECNCNIPYYTEDEIYHQS